jgi:hypothetical protein
MFVPVPSRPPRGQIYFPHCVQILFCLHSPEDAVTRVICGLVTPSTASRARKSGIGNVNPSSHRRNAELAPDLEAEILSWIAAQSEKQHCLGRTEVLNHLRDICGVPIAKGTKNPCAAGSDTLRKIHNCTFRGVS